MASIAMFSAMHGFLAGSSLQKPLLVSTQHAKERVCSSVLMGAYTAQSDNERRSRMEARAKAKREAFEAQARAEREAKESAALRLVEDGWDVANLGASAQAEIEEAP